jgi:DNA-directed RNA polymerase specialized sigma subunit
MGTMSADDFKVLSELTTSELESATQIVEWGHWSRGSIPGYAKTGSGRTPNISDHQAGVIDSIIADLGGRAKSILLLIYVHEKPMYRIEEKYSISNRRVSAYRDRGLNYLHGSLKQLSRNSF